MRRGKRKIDGPFVAIPIKIMDTRAWRCMSPTARVLWTELRRKLRSDFLNNGKIYLACRVAAKATAVDKSTIARHYAELEHYGFLRKTTGAYLGLDGRGIAPHYRFTDLMHGTHPATRDYEKWDGELFAYTPRRQAGKLESRPQNADTPSQNTDIRKVPGAGSVCPQNTDIDSPRRCPQNTDISRLPVSHEVGSVMKDSLQGSLTVRAPAQVGGGGSSPPPVANDLAAMVLGIVHAQLDELEARRAQVIQFPRQKSKIRGEFAQGAA